MGLPALPGEAPLTLPSPPNGGRGFFVLSEERQRRLAERLQGPQCAAAVEPDRAEGVGFGEALERAAAETAAPPQRPRIRIPASSSGDEPLRIGLGEPFYLAQPEAHRP